MDNPLIKINNLGQRKYELINLETNEAVEYTTKDLKVIEKALNTNKFLTIKKDKLVMVESTTNSQATVEVKVKMNIKNEIERSLKSKTNDLIISDLDWKYLVRNVLRGQNTIMVGPTGTGKTSTAYAVAKALGREDRFFKFPMNSTTDAKTALIGSMAYSPDKGTFFKESEFVRAIQTENAIILLDEYTRCHPDAENILFSVLDHQRYLKIDEADFKADIKVANGVTFIATANMGITYTTTRILDEATTDRFLYMKTKYLTHDEEVNLMTSRYPEVDTAQLNSIIQVAQNTRKQSMDQNMNKCLSTRKVDDIVKLVNDGFSPLQALNLVASPLFEDDGTSDCDGVKFRAVVDQFVEPTEDDNVTAKKPLSKGNIFNGATINKK